jgi:hypothetical protein
LLLLVLLHLDHLVFSHRLAEGVVVAGVVRELLVGEPDDVRAHAIEEVLAVAHHHKALFIRLEVVLQPHARL